MKTIAFYDWITRETTKEISLTLGIDPSNVRQWRCGFCLPRPEQMVLIHKKSGGRVQYGEMIESYLKLKAKRKRKERTKSNAKAK